ncbi:NAD(P)-dependent oxidoreductase [candidate division KSB1 bacterium]|nr:NAD(P)-dependent oxidoreductase [candidate division KSB1 bacterium]NIR71259.1 NAD(P)-dependent oxidoreductase [candidate division KSB1 bacterium]NIS24788.1 NAD(P)-dependent oxidoreductase [candidate division KSB1 bacterium]NIT71695.1 NAD(P)-dependent oxidoreductase [candidate division KSB1 bacterium]NIU25424.1 NAD(P)-dependent oxidoreductase [candidate division KSB1 bacterium]
MKKVLVTGATGFIGYEVSRRLCKLGFKPRLLVRRPLRGGLLAPLAAELVQGDLQSPESLSRAVKDVDTILHLGARAAFEEYKLLRPTIIDGSTALMKAAISAGVKKFVYASSLLVYANQAEPIDHDTAANSGLGYGRAKLEAEQALSKLAEEADVSFAAIRLPHVYGARDLMFEQVRQGRVIFPGNGHNLFAHLHIEDAAKILIEVGRKGWTGISAVGDYLAATWNDFFGVIREYYPRFSEIGVPRWLALLGTRLYTPFRRLQHMPSLYTPEAVIGWNLNLPVEPGLLWNELDIEPNYPTIRFGIPAVLDDCIAFRWIHPLADKK